MIDDVRAGIGCCLCQQYKEQKLLASFSYGRDSGKELKPLDGSALNNATLAETALGRQGAVIAQRMRGDYPDGIFRGQFHRRNFADGFRKVPGPVPTGDNLRGPMPDGNIGL